MELSVIISDHAGIADKKSRVVGQSIMATAVQQVKGTVLHPRLLNFFARFPPRLYGVHFTGERIPTVAEKIAIEGNKKTGEGQTLARQSLTTKTGTSSRIKAAGINRTVPAASSNPELSSPLIDPETSDTLFDIDPTTDELEPNPFLPYRNPATGHWRGPRWSLRRQAELFKLARLYGVESLLPPSVKATEYKEKRLLERGLAVKGTGVGEKVKGHKWEREMPGLLQKRIEAMEKMPGLIREWRMRGNGRGWKKYPR